MLPAPITEANPDSAAPADETAPVAPNPVVTDPVAANPVTSSPVAPKPSPPNAFADELPPDFWGEALELPDVPQTARDADLNRELNREPDNSATPFADTSARPNAPAKPVEGKLEADPRFVLMTELFPGRVTDFASAEAPASTAAETLEDAPDMPETVDLDEGLDSDDDDDSDL